MKAFKVCYTTVLAYSLQLLCRVIEDRVDAYNAIKIVGSVYVIRNVK